MNFLDADVPDPTDFPPATNAPGLRALDGAFRCDICGDLYDAPATIACGHCFCSACIRSSLALKQECPTCRKTSNEAHIRPNPALENVISSWQQARPYILGLIKREKERETYTNTSDKGTAKKRKRSVERSSSIADAPGTNTPGPSWHVLATSKGAESSNATPKPQSRVKKLKPKSGIDVTTIPNSDVDEGEMTPPLSAAPKQDALVKCPLCQRQIVYRLLNTHMDNNCKDPPAPPEHNNKAAANSWLKLMGDPQGRHGVGQHKGKHKKRGSDSDDDHPLPLTSYATLKDRQLKDMLSEQGLPVTGSRTVWEQRHQRWVLLFNANLDKSIPNRKTRSELRRDLKRWEDERGKGKKTVVRDTQQYQVDHKDEFARLVHQARESKKKLQGADLKNGASSPSATNTSTKESDDVIVIDSEEERLTPQS